MNEQKFDDREIKMLYKENVQRTAPDMEKLWSRIERTIDETDKTDNVQRTITQIKGKRTAGRLIAWAAAFAVVAAGAFIAVKLGDNKPAKQNSETPSYSADTTDSISRRDKQTGIPPEQKNEEKAAGEQENNTPSDNIQNNTPSGETQNEAPSEEARNDTPSDNTQNNTEDEGDQKNATSGMYGKQAVDYSTLPLGHSGIKTAAYKASGDEFFVEETVLEQTSMFIDVRVIKAEQSAAFCTYTLDVIACFTKDGDELTGTLQLDSSSPLLLSEDGEYLLPIVRDEKGMHIAFENAPQIEYTKDGRIVFHNGWQSLNSGSEQCIYPANAYDEFYYDRMRIGSADTVSELIEKWKTL